jgi:probable F420-dependent oxidoreductase
MTPRVTGTGIWSSALRYGDAAEVAEAAAELEELGYRALWIPDVGGEVFGPIANLLAATRTTTVATGILNVWLHPATETAAQHAALTEEHGDRFLVGLGVSHAHLIDRMLDPGTYQRPLAQMRAYLDDLDRAEPPLPAASRVLAALGPKMLQLARERSAGVHPYLVTPEHTAIARAAVGDEGLVAPEQGVVHEADADRAREIARGHLARYLEAPNYTNSWRRLGFTEDDLAGGGSDRLVDALVAWGDDAALAARVQAHRDAGADHVCIQVLGDEPRRLTLDAWRALAPALT